MMSLTSLVEKSRQACQFSDDEWFHLLRMDKESYEEVLTGDRPISILELDRLADKLNLNLENFRDHNIDFTALAVHQTGRTSYIPEKYLHSAFSQRRTSLNILKYVETFHGWEMRQKALRTLQVTEDVFQNPDLPININFFSDLCGILEKNGFLSSEFIAMGSYSVITNSKGPVSDFLKDSGDIETLYERVIVDLMSRYFEKNCEYRLLFLNKTGCLIESRSKKDVAEGLGVKELGSKLVCLTKIGVAASIPGYLGLPFSTVKKTSCVHQGDASCRYTVKFMQPV